MTMRAYCEDYLDGARRVLGDMLDFAVNSCGYGADEFWHLFITSEISGQFERGNPTYVAGMTGCELCRKIIVQSGLKEPEAADEMYIDRSEEYWAGWALAYYQWQNARKFSYIYRAVPMSEILRMYTVYHEMDISQFTAALDGKISLYYTETRLKFFRKNAGFSQSELAREADVPLRQIQLFEQRRRDINKAGALSVAKLARALHCTSEDILEI